MPTPALTPTCSSLRQLAEDQSECETVGGDDCTTVECTRQNSFFPAVATMTVLPCNQPPGVSVVIGVGPIMLLDRIFVASENVSTPGNGTVRVTLDQMEDSLGFKVCIFTIDYPDS